MIFQAVAKPPNYRWLCRLYLFMKYSFLRKCSNIINDKNNNEQNGIMNAYYDYNL